jgi:hypothetical protein
MERGGKIVSQRRIAHVSLSSQFNDSPVTGNVYGENSTATTQAFQIIPAIWNGLLQCPRFHLGLGKVLGVKKTLPKQISPYAAAEGTPAAEIRDVNATLDGKIVQVTTDATAQTTMIAFWGCPVGDT